MGGLPTIVRTLDIGGDKNARYLASRRGQLVPRHPGHPPVPAAARVQAQLRAIYRASEHGPLSVMFPMIARLEDLEAAIDHAEIARATWGPSRSTSAS